MNTTAPVIALDHPAALDVARVGRKAANLAAARAAGLPVAAGVVLTTDWPTEDRATAAQVWRITSHDGARALVVRPSATGRERRRATDVGAIEPVTVVTDLAAMMAAVDALRAEDPTTPVLLQPHLEGSWRGVLFADDSATGWRATPLVVARRDTSRGDTSRGEWIAEVDHAGRVRDVLSAQPLGNPPAEVLVRLGRLADRVTAAFDGPHDLEWIADAGGRLQLLRIRPVVRLRATPSSTATPLPRAHRARRRRAQLEPVGADGHALDGSAA
jgi:pyruvate,water dikinase